MRGLDEGTGRRRPAHVPSALLPSLPHAPSPMSPAPTPSQPAPSPGHHAAPSSQPPPAPPPAHPRSAPRCPSEGLPPSLDQLLPALSTSARALFPFRRPPGWVPQPHPASQARSDSRNLCLWPSARSHECSTPADRWMGYQCASSKAPGGNWRLYRGGGGGVDCGRGVGVETNSEKLRKNRGKLQENCGKLRENCHTVSNPA